MFESLGAFQAGFKRHWKTQGFEDRLEDLTTMKGISRCVRLANHESDRVALELG